MNVDTNLFILQTRKSKQRVQKLLAESPKNILAVGPDPRKATAEIPTVSSTGNLQRKHRRETQCHKLGSNTGFHLLVISAGLTGWVGKPTGPQQEMCTQWASLKIWQELSVQFQHTKSSIYPFKWKITYWQGSVIQLYNVYRMMV